MSSAGACSENGIKWFLFFFWPFGSDSTGADNMIDPFPNCLICNSLHNRST